MESNTDNGVPSRSRFDAVIHKTKPFIKFTDNKYRTGQIKKYKSNLKKNNVRNSLHLPTLSTPSRSQIVSKKILRSIKKRRIAINNKITSQSPSKATRSEMFKDYTISIANPSTSTLVRNKDFDDDCVCIDPQPEVIVIEDESMAAVKGNNQRQELKQYEPIGTMRTNQSTSRLKWLSDPFYGDANPMRGPLMSDSLFSAIEDCSLVQKYDVDDEVVVIDDMITASNKTVKTENSKLDDSVIFVSEKVLDIRQPTPAPAYIPLDTPVEESHFRLIPRHTSIPKLKQLRNELFSSKEQKQLRKYNDNAYNPNRDVPTLLAKKRMVIIDGSNVAYQHALNKEFSVKGLKICLDYFEKMGHEAKAVVPQFRLQRLKSSDPNELQKLHQDGKIVFTPCKNLPGKSSTSYDDRFVLQLAAELDAAVVSNDNYRDLINENPAFKKIIENRVIGYTWCNDLFILPKDPYGKWGPTLTTILNRS